MKSKQANPKIIRTESVKVPQPGSFWDRFRLLLGGEVSGASLALLRIGLGIVMVLEAYSLVRPDHGSTSGGLSQLETYFTGPDIHFHFPFPLFSWVPLLSATWIYVTVGLVAMSGVLVAIGLFYRPAIVTLLLSYGYLWVAESTRTYWQSYYYIEILVILFLVWMPADRMFSVDAWRARKRGHESPETIPFWPIFLLRAQLVIAYFYAGFAKLNKDWLLDAAPARWFLTDPGVLGPYERIFPSGLMSVVRSFVESEAFAFFLSYTGLFFDLSIGFLFLFRRTRIFALALMICFHATNHLLIFDDIEWFPVVGVLTALIFLDPDWPIRVGRWLRKPGFTKPEWNWFWPGAILFPGVGAALGWKLKRLSKRAGGQSVSMGLALTIAIWLVLQILIPLRHLVIAGDGRFTYEGMSFSWRLKTEIRRAVFHELTISDEAILRRGQVNWEQWHGERTIYRQVKPGAIEWETMPEIFVLLEPLIGERVMFNPYPKRIRTAAEAEKRLQEVWGGISATAPESVAPTLPFPGVISLISQSLRNSGKVEEAERTARLAQQTDLLERTLLPPQEAQATRREIAALLREVREKKLAARELRRTAPLVLEGEFDAGLPFLLIDDARLYEQQNKQRVDRSAWMKSSGGVLVVQMGQLGVGGKDLLPKVYLLETPDRTLQIRWNSMRDLSPSKLLHTSIQPFYLRRYARRVADLWAMEYERRPSVHATTSMSLNGRPHQQLVDPDANLATVTARWLRHNSWIRDLQTPRIPPEALVPGKRI